ncbi:MAG: enoyl-CoA hydratase [Sandaracinaceae bacterium]|nr:enoyl-CoA hydratase [Sandaracinaceae bacterium]
MASPSRKKDPPVSVSEKIQVSTESGVREIVIARPETKNSLLVSMYEAFTEALLAAEVDPEVQVILVRGEGGQFSSGNDLKDFLENAPDGPESPVFRFMHVIAECQKPIVAAVDGFAVGIGSTLLLHCDIVYAAPETQFILPFVNLALCPEAGSALVLPRVAGHRRAAEVFFFGEPFGTDLALELGLVSCVVPNAELLEHARKRARKLAEKPQRALLATKQLLKRHSGAELNAHIDTEAVVFCDLLKSDELKEAIGAFFEKRKPDFSRFR